MYSDSEIAAVLREETPIVTSVAELAEQPDIHFEEVNDCAPGCVLHPERSTADHAVHAE
ncbi:MAG: hypothetical protein IT405_02440 [Candidatus Yanofskybacteria bacterium]|nr:hypothetical protein [Candidatus Yanofskybacteria bacterium]